LSGSGISLAVRKSAPRSRQITTPAPHHLVFTGRMPCLSSNQQRQSTEGTIHQAAKLVAALLRVAGVTAGLAESNGSLPSGLWLTSPAGWLQRTGISSGTLRSVIDHTGQSNKLMWTLNASRKWRRYLGNGELEVLLSDVNPSFPQRIHAGFCAYALQPARHQRSQNQHNKQLLLLFWHAPLAVRSAIHRHQPPGMVLGQVDCFDECEVVGSQIVLDGVQPRDTSTPWWSLPVIGWGSR